MTFALCLQIPNHLRFNRKSDIWTSFLPQLLFLECIFGYLVICILYKWSVDWSAAGATPPSLLNMLIAMFLTPGTVVEGDTRLYPGQGGVQVVLLLVALVCVPWMLCVKPYLQWKELQQVQAQGYINLGHADENNGFAPRQDEELEGEEEGNGRVIAEAEEEHVRSFCPFTSLSTMRARSSCSSRCVYRCNGLT